MKILHTGDLHLGKTLEGQSRESEQQQILAEIGEIVRKEQVDLLLIAGDIFDTFNPSAEAEALYYDFLEDITKAAGCGIVLIAGNHDQPRRLAAAAPLALRHSIYILAAPNTIIPLQKEGYNPRVVASGENWLELAWQGKDKENVVIAALPYISEGRMGQLISPDLGDEDENSLAYSRCLQKLFCTASMGYRQDTVNLAMAHVFAIGGKTSDTERTIQVGGSFGVRADAFPPAAQYIALGHLHRKQQIKSPQACFYSGAPLACGFGEVDQAKSLILAELTAGGPPKLQELPLQAGYPLHQEVFLDYDAAYIWCQDPAHQNNWLNIQIHCATPLKEAEIKSLRAAHPRLLRIEVVLPTTGSTPSPGCKQLSFAERFQLFVTQKTGVAPSQELTALFLQLTEAEQTLFEEEHHDSH